jgi:hypothetical protein
MEASGDRRASRMALAQEWKESGKSARIFAQEHGVTPWTLYYWRQLLTASHVRGSARRRRRRSRRPLNLVPVRVRVTGHPDEAPGELEVILATGDRVRLSARVSAEQFQRVVQVLKAC